MTIEQIISKITVKILVGIGLTSVWIISLWIVFQDFHAFLGGFEKGAILQLGVFLFFVFASLVGLYILFRNPPAKNSDLKEESFPFCLLTSDLQNLGLKFVEGFLKGLLQETEKDKNK